ncbi:MAG: radical SAM protein [Myxococcota bacterium]
MFRFYIPRGLPDYDMPLYRPPSEADSLIFQVTLGCSHNKCAFCFMYRDKRFRIRPRENVIAEIETAAVNLPSVRRIFFADGDSLVVKTKTLIEYAELCYKRFPKLERIGVYATPQNFLVKSVAELKSISSAGVTIAYFGVESGDPTITRLINKGVTIEDMERAAKRAMDTGFTLSVTVLVGLGGTEKSAQHAENTGRFISRVEPHYASALTLMLGPFEEQYRKEYGESWTPLDKYQSLEEIRLLIENIETKREVVFRANHASNWLALKGTLPADKGNLLKLIDDTLSDPDSPHWRPEEWRAL